MPLAVYDCKEALQWHHNGRDGVSDHQPRGGLLNRLFKHWSKKTSKLRVTGLCAGNSPVTGEFPAQMASKAGFILLASVSGRRNDAEGRRWTAAASELRRKLRRAWKYKQDSVYVRVSPLQNNASAPGDLLTLSWLAGMPALVYAGLESSTWLNSVDVCARLRPHTLSCIGPRLHQKYKQYDVLRWTPPFASANGR